MRVDTIARMCIRPHPKCKTVFSRYLSTESPKPFESVPGLKALPIIGVLHHFIPIFGTVGFQKNFFNMFDILNKKFGPIVKIDGIFGRGTMVVLFEPGDYEKVYRAEETNPLRPGVQALDYYREVLRKERYDGVYGLTSAQGEKWRDFRTKVNPALLKPKLVKLYAPGLEQIAEDSIARLLRFKDEPKEFSSEITKWSLESVALVGLGNRLGCLQDNLPADHPSQKLMYCSKTIADLMFKLEFIPNWNKEKSANFKKMMEMYDLQWDVSEMYINQAKKQIRERGHDVPDEDQSILEKLLAIDERVAVMMANEMLLAGIDTVAFTVTGLLYHLATNQEAQEKVRREIREQKSARYLKACLKESMRLMPILPGNLRQTSKEHVVGGYLIPKGVFAVTPNENLSKSEKHYVQAKEFIPERWLAEKSDPLYHGNTHPMVTLPFGFGVRSCIGRRIAELEIEIFTKKLLNTVRVTWTGPPLQVITKLMNEFRTPYHFKFENIV
ncbi:cytochrome P450 CYP12A2-like isoform X1 [Ostrinia furnacalis]|uniref:Cytochrome P450 monooxygenase CYP333A20 n=2 Tax=Ostrinia furnacalis TaxID=93504 RepID=A0A7S9CEH5_OSTFU|nr:cytochrome P450 CYP12A2-like isoform X1 [Ostrinia furnacalis]QPF77619.1 cytochrome P450 monooxygenase CYP333A20 [Ostrinia furnacalis]